MATLVSACLVALVLLWVSGERVVARFQRVGKAVSRVRRDLSGTRSSEGYVEVTSWKAHPLSEHMVKELAAAEGLEYVHESTKYGSRYMRFTQRKDTDRA